MEFQQIDTFDGLTISMHSRLFALENGFIDNSPGLQQPGS